MVMKKAIKEGEQESKEKAFYYSVLSKYLSIFYANYSRNDTKEDTINAYTFLYDDFKNRKEKSFYWQAISKNKSLRYSAREIKHIEKMLQNGYKINEFKLIETEKDAVIDAYIDTKSIKKIIKDKYEIKNDNERRIIYGFKNRKDEKKAEILKETLIKNNMDFITYNGFISGMEIRVNTNSINTNFTQYYSTGIKNINGKTCDVYGAKSVNHQRYVIFSCIELFCETKKEKLVPASIKNIFWTIKTKGKESRGFLKSFSKRRQK